MSGPDYKVTVLSVKRSEDDKWAVVTFALDRGGQLGKIKIGVDAERLDAGEWVAVARQRLHAHLTALAALTTSWAAPPDGEAG